MKALNVIDLFCGGGGTSTGVIQAAYRRGLDVNLTAINSWEVAVETHSANHPFARHICKNIMAVDPLRVGHRKGRLHLMTASPECKWHSKARGKQPINDQLRISAWDVVRFTEELLPWVLVVENVTEYQDWGPVNQEGRPIKRYKGKIFQSWWRALESLGYTLERRVLCSADYGDPTIRKRLFIIGYRKQAAEIAWPSPTHSKGGEGGLRCWRSAAEIIDWEYPSRSIFNREKRPLCENTLRRIRAGIEKFYGEAAGPFLQFIDRGMKLMKRGKPIPLPFPIQGLPSGFIVPQHSWEPFRSSQLPVPTLMTTSTGVGLTQPVAVVPHRGERAGQSPRSHALTQPFPAVTTQKGHGVVQSLLVQFARKQGENRSRDLLDPAPTFTTKCEHGVMQPFISLYYSSGGQLSAIDKPTPTITCEDRLSVVEPKADGVCVDILYRMLNNGELSRAMGFPDNYVFKGTDTEQTKQIGNAVTVNKARSIADAQLTQILQR